jgi:uncharacterized protein
VTELASIIEYPLDFPIKVLGPNRAGFVEQVASIVRNHAPDFDPLTLEQRPSREGRFLSVTVTIRATSREQLDALYQALSDHPMVSMAL